MAEKNIKSEDNNNKLTQNLFKFKKIILIKQIFFS